MANPLRVLFVVGSLGGGGDERQVIGILQHLNRARFRPFLYLMYPEGELLDEVPADVPMMSYWGNHPKPRFYFPGRIRRLQIDDLTAALQEHEIDLVCDHHFHMTLVAGPASHRARRARVSVAVNDPKLDLKNAHERFGWLKRRLLRTAYSTAERVAAVSEGVREAMIKFYRLSPEQVVTVYNFVDLERIDRLADAAAPDFDQDRFHLVAAGRLHYQKGYSYLLDAMRELVHQRNRKQLLLHLLGQGPLEAELRATARALQLDDHVHFAGFIQNPFPWIRNAQLYCMSSLYEGMPNALIEAMACGVPVLSTDCPSGPRELLGEGRYGRLVQPGDALALAESIEDALLNYSSWQERTAAARDKVEQDFSFSGGILQVEELLCSAYQSRMSHR